MAKRRHVLLLEIAYWRRVLLESRLDFLKQKYIPLLMTSWKNANGAIFNKLDRATLEEIETRFNQYKSSFGGNKPDEDQKVFDNIVANTVFDKVVETDPDIHKKNVQWMLNIILSGKSLIEDLYKATQYLQTYERVKRLLPVEKRDINKYKSFAELYEVIEPYEKELSKREVDRQYDAEMHQQAEVLYNSPNYKIVSPLTQEAACYFGVNTQWCTAATGSRNYFHVYNNESQLYIILDKANNERWQYHFYSQQFMDERDRQINTFDWINKHKEAAEALEAVLPKPITSIENYSPGLKNTVDVPVYKLPNGNYIARLKSSSNDGGAMLRNTITMLTIKVDENNKLKSVSQVNDSLFNTKDVVKLLNELQIGAGLSNHNSNFDIYYRNNQWITVLEAAKPFLKYSDGMWWGKIQVSKTLQRFLLITSKTNTNLTKNGFPKSGYFLGALFDNSLGESIFKVIENPSHMGDAFGKYIVDLLLKIDAKTWIGTSEYEPKKLPERDAKRLLKYKPYLCDLQVEFNAKGVTPDIKRRTLKELDKEQIALPTPTRWLGKDRLIVKIWDNIDDCMDDLGTSDGKNFYQYYIKDGGVNNDHYWPEDVSYFEGELMEYAHKEEPELFKKIGEYLAEEYPDIIEELFDNEDDETTYDPTNINNVREILKETDDNDVIQALKTAGASGYESGAQSEANEIFKNTVEKNPYLFFTTGEKAIKNKQPKWSKKLREWDSKVIMAVPLAEVIEMVDEDSDTLYREGWASIENSGLNPESPYNGMSEFDWDYAKDRFVEELRQIF